MADEKNCIIIHGCPSSKEELLDINSQGVYYKHWIPWVREHLIARGIPTVSPLMPEAWVPVYEKFKKEFEKYQVNNNSILIGHSCGCAFLVRWLGDTKQKIKKLILVAPWKIPYSDGGYREKFYTYDIDSSIKERVDEIIMFTSDTESNLGKKSLKIFNDALKGRIINLPNHGHYLVDQMGTQEFPEILEVI